MAEGRNSRRRRPSTSMIAVRGPSFHVPHLPGQGDLWTKHGPERLVRASRTPDQGVAVGPRTSARARRSSCAAAAGLSRRCRAGPRPSRTERRPFFQLGRCGPTTSISATVPCPSSSLSRRTTVGREQLELGGPGGGVGAHHAACRRRTTPACSARATSAPTSSGQRPKTPCTRRSSSQPWSSTSRPSVVSSSCGSRSSGCAPETRPGPAGRGASASPPRLRRRARRGRGSAPGPGRGRRRGGVARPASAPAVARRARRLPARRPASRRRARRPVPQASRTTSPSADQVAHPGQGAAARRRPPPR